MRSNTNVRSYVEIEIQLHSCVEDPVKLHLDLKKWLQSRFEIDFDSDIDISYTATGDRS